jgi:GT2 family glycosyltransferase
VRSLVSAFAPRRRAARASDPWGTYLAAVEPAVAAQPRVHRFAQPPLLADPGLRATPIAVWIGPGHVAQRARSRAAVVTGTEAPAAILDGSLERALSQTRAEHVLLVRAGDETAPLALERLGQALTLAPEAHVVTCDDDVLRVDGSRHAPRFRPGPSPDHWLACDDSGPMLLVARDHALRVAGRLAGASAWRHELALRLAGPASEHHAHVPLLLCHRGPGREDAPPLHPEVVQAILRGREPAARVHRDGAVRTIGRPLAGEPAVDIIVCFRDRPELLAPCVASVFARTDYEHLHMTLVDNGSKLPETAELLRRLTRNPNVRMLRDPRSFNFAALNNHAASSSPADVLVFLNNDTEVLDPDWLPVLLEEALRPDVGAVAPLLLYPDGSVQHAGAALGLHGYAGHPFAGLAPDAATPFGRAAGGTRNWLAVTAACMVIERAKFFEVGGFDESFVVGGNDVDLCLRLTASGHRSLCVPRTSLLHDESRSRGTHVDPGDFAASERSYGEFRTIGDPFYNPNLTLTATDCSVRVPTEETT